MELARKLKVPVVIHSREAAKDTMDIMTENDAAGIGGVVHCYSYSPEMARQYVDMGFYIGVGGVITFNNGRRLRETVVAIPLERIVLETDAPYLAPQPYRGKRNCSLYIPHMAQAIADIKGVDVEMVYEQTYENAHRLYGII
jgi:TatD DNase family protein